MKRVAYFVGDSGGELAQFNQLLAADHLVLGVVQLLKDVLQFFVFSLQVFG